MKTFEQARKFIYRNARPLDLALWDYHFEGGNKETVLNALAWYQNKDGGFAHGLEPDLWSDYSSPLATSRAIELLKSIAFFDCSHEITQGILRYLENTPFQNEKGWFLKIPANNESPHAIWWDYSKETEMGFYGERGYNPTATLAGFIIKTADQTSAIYQKAVLIIQEAISKIVEDDSIEMHEVACFCSLLSFLEIAEGLDDKIDTDVLKTHLQIAIGNSIEKDISKWSNYVGKPSQFFKDPASIFYLENKQSAEYECDYMIETQQENGAWPVTWSWGSYPKEFAISSIWSQSYFIIENSLYLRGFGRL